MTLQLEMVSCGDCAKCLAGGKVHGPYWYRYFRRNGKMVSEYVGKEIGSKDATKDMPEGSTPEDLFPERVQDMREAAERDARKRLEALPSDPRKLIDSVVGMKAKARRAYRRSRKEDATAGEREAAGKEKGALMERIVAEKSKLRVTVES